jgi:hypothetical protein
MRTDLSLEAKRPELEASSPSPPDVQLYTVLVSHFRRHGVVLLGKVKVFACLSIKIIHLMTSDHAMVRDVKRQPVVVKVRAHSQDSSSGICGSKRGTGTGFPPCNAFFLC